MSIQHSELILNPDGSIYHLHLKPGDVAETIITVGDPDRVAAVSKYFDEIELRKQHREFCTHTGWLNDKRISVVSTGIGPDNIDIVFNELDALFNIDFQSRNVLSDKKHLDIIRIGTSGATQADIPMDSLLISEVAIGFDNLMHFYRNASPLFHNSLIDSFVQHLSWNEENSRPYAVSANEVLLRKFQKKSFQKGITTTNVGFYGPQSRILRLPLQDPELADNINSFRFEGQRITNLEMETAAIYGMAFLLGHRAISLNAILANRVSGTFSEQPQATVDRLIQETLEILTS